MYIYSNYQLHVRFSSSVGYWHQHHQAFKHFHVLQLPGPDNPHASHLATTPLCIDHLLIASPLKREEESVKCPSPVRSPGRFQADSASALANLSATDPQSPRIIQGIWLLRETCPSLELCIRIWGKNHLFGQSPRLCR